MFQHQIGSYPTSITTHLRREKWTSVAIEIKKGPVFPGSNVAGMIVNTSSSEVLSSMNPVGVETSWVGTIGDPSYGRPWPPNKQFERRDYFGCVSWWVPRDRPSSAGLQVCFNMLRSTEEKQASFSIPRGIWPGCGWAWGLPSGKNPSCSPLSP